MHCCGAQVRIFFAASLGRGTYCPLVDGSRLFFAASLGRGTYSTAGGTLGAFCRFLLARIESAVSALADDPAPLSINAAKYSLIALRTAPDPLNAPRGFSSGVAKRRIAC